MVPFIHRLMKHLKIEFKLFQNKPLNFLNLKLSKAILLPSIQAFFGTMYQFLEKKIFNDSFDLLKL